MNTYYYDMIKNDAPEPNFVFDPKNPPAQCTAFHPPLPLNIQGKEVEIFASSCLKPNNKNAQIFISLDEHAPLFSWEKPWIKNKHSQTHIRYFVPDMSVPEDPEDFDKLLDYTIDLLKNGKTVHVGCIAGHGRTGLFLAALVQKTMPEKLLEDNISAIDYVRDNYCAKAVETLAQIFYLNANYNVEFPIYEQADVKECKQILELETGYAYEQILQDGFFMDIINNIDDIEMRMDLEKNPQKYEKQLNYTKRF